jgi:histidinol phosphatase-like PHP family hydrolase
LAVRKDEVLAAAAESKVAVDVNGSSHRLDLSAAHASLALRLRVKLVVSADAHLGNVRDAVLTARRAGARRGQVLNTGSAGAS